MKNFFPLHAVVLLAVSCLVALILGAAPAGAQPAVSDARSAQMLPAHAVIVALNGQQTFRFDTFGDEDFWGGTLRLHEAIEGEALGGVGPGVSPNTALAVGLKVDVDALPQKVVEQLKHGKLNLDDPAVTLALLKLNAIVGVKGIFSGATLSSMGITCGFCHSTVDNSLAYGIGHRLDGFANRDLDVGTIVSLSPNLQPLATLLGVDLATVQTVLLSWGPGKFDAELFLDGKAFNPSQVTDGTVTGTNVSGATLIPNAYGLSGYNQVTWTGAWGTTTYWNAFVANIEMHGKGTFFDPRLDDASKFPIAAANGFGHIRTDPDEDLITSKLPDLSSYQALLPAPNPTPGVDFDQAAAVRGDALFGGKARCVTCHAEPLWTEPGWNLHTPAEVGVDAFEANRAPDNRYKTMNLAGLFVRENGLYMKPENKGRYYHDGRFATLLDVVDHYNTLLSLGLSGPEKSDVVEYLKSLGGPDAGAFGKPVGTLGSSAAGPSAARLEQNYPNPFNPATKISYDLSTGGVVNLDVYSLNGQLVRRLVGEQQDAGHYNVEWNGRDGSERSMASGIYFYRLEVSGRTLRTNKMILIK